MARLANSEFGNMKKSSEWVRQPGLDKKLDHLVEERGCTPAELVPYDASKALDIEPSGEFYKKVRDWKQRRAAENDTPVMEVPPHVQAEFRETIDRFAAEAMNSFLRAVRGVGGDLDRVAALRVADAERRADDARTEANDYLDRWTAAERERDTALAEMAKLEQAFVEAQHRGNELFIRLQEREALLEKLLETPKMGLAATSPVVSRGQQSPSESRNEYDRSVGGITVIDAGIPLTESSVAASAAKEPDEPLIEEDHSTTGQVEMPLIKNDAANQAQDDGDDLG